MIATVKHRQGSIEFSQTRIDERLDKIPQPYTFVGYRALGYLITEQTDAIAVGRIDVAQVIALPYIGRIKSFRSVSQLGSTEEVLQKVFN